MENDCVASICEGIPQRIDQNMKNILLFVKVGRMSEVQSPKGEAVLMRMNELKRDGKEMDLELSRVFDLIS